MRSPLEQVAMAMLPDETSFPDETSSEECSWRLTTNNATSLCKNWQWELKAIRCSSALPALPASPALWVSMPTTRSAHRGQRSRSGPLTKAPGAEQERMRSAHPGAQDRPQRRHEEPRPARKGSKSPPGPPAEAQGATRIAHRGTRTSHKGSRAARGPP